MNLLDMWEEMEGSIQPTGEGRVFRRLFPEASLDIFASIIVGGVPVQKVRAIELEIPDEVAQAVDLPGGTKQVACDLVSRSPGTIALVFVLSEDGNQELFSAMARDIAGTTALCDDPYSAAATWCGRFGKWRRMFEGAGRGLSTKAQMGLQNELLTMVEQLVPAIGIEAAIRAWIGPLGNPRDFEVSAFGIEAKSSGANEPQVVAISNERQLDDSELSGLALVHRSFEVVRGGEQTLPFVVERIRTLADGTVAESALEEMLLLSGYLDANAALYETSSFETRRIRIFLIREGFPRITETDLIDGVGSVAYRLAIDACHEFEIELDSWAGLLESYVE